MTATRKFLKIETNRALVYWQLAEAFRPPSPAMSDGLREMASALALLESAAAPAAARLAAGRYTEENMHAITIDHAALFVGPFSVPAPPYGSVYLEDKRQLMGDSTIDARRHYLSLGLDMSPDFKEAPDHVCAELEFMHVLIRQGLEADEAADCGTLSENVRRQRVFLEKHLAAWIPAFTAKITDHARTDYYRDLAEATRRFIADETGSIKALAFVLPALAEAAE